MTNWKKVMILTLILGTLGTSTFFGVKFVLISNIKNTYISEDNKIVNIVQNKLELMPIKVEQDKYTEIKDPFIKLKIPLVDGKITALAQKYSSKIEFDNNKQVIFMGRFDADFTEYKKEFNNSQLNFFKNHLGDSFSTSEYEFLKAIQNCTPDHLDLSSSFSEIIAYKAALTCKSLILPGVIRKDGKIYYFDNETVRGFMYSGSNEKGKVITIEFYTDDFTRYNIIANLSEEEAKYIISSIEFIE